MGLLAEHLANSNEAPTVVTAFKQRTAIYMLQGVCLCGEKSARLVIRCCHQRFGGAAVVH